MAELQPKPPLRRAVLHFCIAALALFGLAGVTWYVGMIAGFSGRRQYADALMALATWAASLGIAAASLSVVLSVWGWYRTRRTTPWVYVIAFWLCLSVAAAILALLYIYGS